MIEVYRVNAQDIMYETIDGEVVIVNLDSGAYYAFDGSGEYIWNRLSEGGASREQLVTELRSRFDTSADDIASGVDSFLAQLAGEGLIMQAAGSATAPVPAGDEPCGVFVAPHLNKYTDMEALLLADPIHEVSADGWPNVK